MAFFDSRHVVSPGPLQSRANIEVASKRNEALRYVKHPALVKFYALLRAEHLLRVGAVGNCPMVSMKKPAAALTRAGLV